jgi:hypothetical protein
MFTNTGYLYCMVTGYELVAHTWYNFTNYCKHISVFTLITSKQVYVHMFGNKYF